MGWKRLASLQGIDERALHKAPQVRWQQLELVSVQFNEQPCFSSSRHVQPFLKNPGGRE
jgi:hypothetical protein